MSAVHLSVHLWCFVIAAWNKTHRVPSFVLCFPHSIAISLEVSASSIAHISTSITSISRSSMSFRCISNCLLYILYVHSFIHLSDIICLKCLLWIKHFPRYGGICCLMKLCPILCNHMDCSSPLGSSIHGILQERTLEWVTISFSRGPPNPGINLCLLLDKQILYCWAIREAHGGNTVMNKNRSCHRHMATPQTFKSQHSQTWTNTFSFLKE